MILLPYGVFCLIAHALAYHGPAVIGGLLIFVACDWITVTIGILTVHFAMLTFIGKVNFFKFVSQFKARAYYSGSWMQQYSYSAGCNRNGA